MNTYGAENFWHKAFSVKRPGTIGYFRYLRPITFPKSGNVVILEVDDEKLVWYDIENKVVKKNGIPNIFLTHPYTESLLQLNEDKRIQKPRLDSKREEPGKGKVTFFCHLLCVSLQFIFQFDFLYIIEIYNYIGWTLVLIIVFLGTGIGCAS